MIRCIRFRPYEKNTLRGFVDLELSRVGIVIRTALGTRRTGKNGSASPPDLTRKTAPRHGLRSSSSRRARRKRARNSNSRRALESIHAVADAQSREAVS